MSDLKVLIGVVTGEYSRRADFYDYLNLLEKPSGSLVLLCHERSPAAGRNLIVEQALLNNCSHVLFIDDDMAYRPNALLQLLEHDKEIISGLYYSRSYPHQPLIFNNFDGLGHAIFIHLGDREERLIRISAAGLGFCLIKTDIFRRMDKPWFRLGELDSEQWCDDVGFFYRVKKNEIQVFCDTECMIGHMGTMIIWPNRTPEGGWMTGYDTNGKGMINTPQVNPMEVKNGTD